MAMLLATLVLRAGLLWILNRPFLKRHVKNGKSLALGLALGLLAGVIALWPRLRRFELR